MGNVQERCVLVTGANGFIGRNLISQLQLQADLKIHTYTRDNSYEDLDRLISEADIVFHLAGVNRPKTDQEFVTGNVELTERIVDCLRTHGKRTPLILASSTQAALDNPYGRSKLRAEQVVQTWGKESGNPVAIFRLPGVFGKWCLPNYNSVVATFCYNLAHGLPLEVSDPSHVLTLVYIDDVVAEFLKIVDASSELFSPNAHENLNVFMVTLGELKNRLEAIRDIRKSLVLPNLGDRLNRYLYATYLSYLPKDNFQYELKKNIDERGWLAEFIKSAEFGQVFLSRTKPGITRGNHWHNTKIEKFLVVNGEAEITFHKKVGSQEIIRYRVSGKEPQVVDIPVGYVHAITNIGNQDLVTLFWASEILDPRHPDTNYEAVVK